MLATELEAIRRDVADIVGERAVSVRESVRTLYARDCWPKGLLLERRGERPFPPDVVVWPGSTEDVARIVQWARDCQVPVTAYGGGTGVVGGATPLRAGVTMDLKRLRRVRLINADQGFVTAEAGIVGARFEAALSRSYLTLGHAPGSIRASTLGGWIATRAAGQFSSRYGKIEDMVQGLVAVAGTGEILRSGPGRAPGPDLVQLVAGTEGTLAIVTEATLAVQPRPDERAGHGLRMKSVEAGLEAMRLIMRAGLRPHVLRLYDPLDSLLQSDRDGHAAAEITTPARALIAAFRARSLGYAFAFPGMLNRAAELVPPRCLLIVAFEGDTRAEVDAQVRSALDIARETGGTDLGEAPAKSWYARRYSTYFKQSAIFAGQAWSASAEVCGTWDRLVPAMEAVRRAVRSDAVVQCRFTHGYLEGCAMQLEFFGAATDKDKLDSGYERVMTSALTALVQSGVSLSHHHGVGVAKARHLADELGDAGMRTLRSLKATFDPDGILNPGKLGL